MRLLRTAALALALAASACSGAPPPKAAARAAVVPKLDVAPGDSHVRYTGRVDRADESRPRFSYPGVTLELAFEGEGASVLLDDQGSSDPKKGNHYQVIVDGEPGKEFVASPEQREYELVTGLSAGVHRVAVYRITESHVGVTRFLGFRVHGKAARLLDLPPRPARRLEIVGDSITCGYGNEAAIEPPPRGNPTTGFTAENENHYLSYGALAARQLGAELHTACVSGVGISRDYGGNSDNQMPDLFLRTLPSAAEPRWDFASYVPDGVIVNLGTNDFGKGLPDPVTFIAAYEGFIAALRELYPRAHISCVTGPMVTDTWPQGEGRLSKLNAWVSGVVQRRREGGDDKISFLALTPQSAPFGEDWHPTLATHRKLARELTGHLRKSLAW